MFTPSRGALFGSLTHPHQRTTRHRGGACFSHNRNNTPPHNHAARGNNATKHANSSLSSKCLSALLGVEPGPCGVPVHGQRDVAQVLVVVERKLHVAVHQPLRLLLVLLRPLQDHLVVDLHQQVVPQLLQPRAPGDLQHGQHGDVRRAALDGRVDGGPQRMLPPLLVARGRVRQIAVAPQQRAHLALLRRVLVLHLLPGAHLRAVAVPQVHRLLRLLGGHSEVLGQAVGGLAVRDGEVEHLGFAALVGEHVLDQRGSLRPLGEGALGPVLEQALPGVHRLSDVRVHPHGCPRVEVPSGLERLPHADAPRHVRQQPQLQLPVVRHHQGVAGLARERLADAVAVLLQRGLVLQRGAPRAQPPRLGVDVERGVDAALGPAQVVGLQRDDEVGQQRVDGGHVVQGVNGGARLRPVLAPPEGVERRPALPRQRLVPPLLFRQLTPVVHQRAGRPRLARERPEHDAAHRRLARSGVHRHREVALGDAVELELAGLLGRLALPPALIPLRPLWGDHGELLLELHPGLLALLVGSPREQQLPHLDAAPGVHVLGPLALAGGPRDEVRLRHALVHHCQLLRGSQVLLVHAHALVLHLRQHVAELAQVVHVELPQRGALLEVFLGGQHRAGVAGDAAQLGLEALAQEPRGLGVQRGVLDPQLALLRVHLDLLHRGQDDGLAWGAVLLELGLPEHFLQAALGAHHPLAGVAEHLARVLHHLLVRRERLQ
mmetsp:Transcript_29160/g.72049  ORF Transcript_29160/g.72049 Transcript_29160/m.72049 type:complete len:718 (-) Transcript_29160:848-3001(-)